MTREEAKNTLIHIYRQCMWAKECEEYGCAVCEDALNMAIEALQTEPIRCGECKHQDDCEEVVLFEINDEEVMGHRLHWCSYGERKGGDTE